MDKNKLMQNTRMMQFIRFGINGVFSAAFHYAIYFVLFRLTGIANVSYATGYIISFISNYFLTCYFTFRTRPSIRRFAGFAGSHAINFGLHIVLFQLFFWLGLEPLIIPVPVIGIAMIIQFLILRLVFKTKNNQGDNR